MLGLKLTPGLSFLLRILPSLLTPPLIAYLAIRLLVEFFDLNIPRLLTLSFLLALPVFLWIRAKVRCVIEDREMATLGAVRVPEISGKWPGNVDLLLGRLKQGRDGYPFDIVEPLTLKYGKIFNMMILGENRIVTTHPAHMKTMLATDVANWEKGLRLRRQQESVLGSGVFNSDGELWKFHRSMTRPFLTRARISDFETFGRYSDEALNFIRDRRGAPFDFQDLALRFTLDVATEFLFGACVSSLQDVGYSSSVTSSTSKFGTALYNVQHHLAQRSRSAPLWPLGEIFRDKTSDDIAIIRHFVDPIIRNALQKRHELETSEIARETEHETLLDHLVHETDDLNVIFDETLNILFAGRETTASLLTFVTYCLSLHPQVAKRLRAEVLDRVGLIRRPGIDELREMVYLRAVINETLRLFPPVPGNVRSPIKGTTLPPVESGGKPFYIPSGAKVPFAIITMHRDKDLWGPDVDEFDPDRFLDDRRKYAVADPFIFHPFSAGPRICLGQQFTYHEASYFLVRIMQTFGDFELALDAQPPESLPPPSWQFSTGRKKLEKIRPKSELTMYVMGGLWLRFGEAVDSVHD